VASLLPLFETPKTFLKANVRPIKLPLGTKMISKGCVFPKYERVGLASLLPLLKTQKTFLKANVRPFQRPL
jgi:hypothetical protein